MRYRIIGALIGIVFGALVFAPHSTGRLIGGSVYGAVGALIGWRLDRRRARDRA